MRRIVVRINEQIYQLLKARAFREGRAIADLIRESIALNGRNAPPRSIDDFSFVGYGSSPADRKDRTSERHDRALADAFVDESRGAPARVRRQRVKTLKRLFKLFEGNDAAEEVRRLKREDRGF